MTNLEKVRRLAEFLRACGLEEDQRIGNSHDAVALVFSALRIYGRDVPGEDRALLKAAALTLAYFRNLRDVADGCVELEEEEREILRAVLTRVGGS
jgi:hypothetical protein